MSTCGYSIPFVIPKPKLSATHKCRLESGHKFEHICSLCGNTAAANGRWKDDNGQWWDAGTAAFMWEHGWRPN